MVSRDRINYNHNSPCTFDISCITKIITEGLYSLTKSSSSKRSSLAASVISNGWNPFDAFQTSSCANNMEIQ